MQEKHDIGKLMVARWGQRGEGVRGRGLDENGEGIKN